MGTKNQKSMVMLAGLLLLLGIQLFSGFEVFQSQAADAPHNNGNDTMNISCSSCHSAAAAGGNQSWWTNQETGVCGSCHNGVLAPLGVSHRTPSGAIIQCTVCHDPHGQMQLRAWKSEAIKSNGTGTVALISSTTMTAFGNPGWATDQWAGNLLVPDTRYPTLNYLIAGNTSNSVTIVSTYGAAINTTYCKPGAVFGIVTSSLVKNRIWNNPVKFFETTGPNSFVGTSDTTTAVCRVCHTNTKYFRKDGADAVALTTSQTGSVHPSGIASIDDDCTTSSCHAHDAAPENGGGFAAPQACGDCHETPPINDATLISKDKDMVDVTSQSPGAGSHALHASKLGDTASCVYCHKGGMVSDKSEGDNNINIVFSSGSTTLSGTYDGKSGRTDFSYASAAPSSVTTGNTLKCSNVYCHNGTLTPAWVADPGSNRDTGVSLPDTAQCDSCHGGNKTATPAAGVGPITSGKHSAHIANTDTNLATYACGRCHAGTVTTGDDRAITGQAKHVNFTKDVSYDSLNTGKSPATSNACSDIYCHSDGKGSYINYTIAANWSGGTTVDCKGCHGVGSTYGEPNYASGGGGTATANSHAGHVTGSADCVKCHVNTTTNGTSISGTIHLDTNIDVTIRSNEDMDGTPTNNYTATVGNKKCSSTTCHGPMSPQWGRNTTDSTCTKCHGVSGTTAAAYSADNRLAAPGFNSTGVDMGTTPSSSPSDPQVGAHQAHLAAPHNYSSPVQCSVCHTLPTQFGDTGHIWDGTNDTTKGVADLLFTGLALTNPGGQPLGSPSYNTPASGQCSNTYCHDYQRFENHYPDDVTAPNAQRTPTWNVALLNGTANDCHQCHGYPPASGHPQDADCSKCHPNVAANDVSFSTPSDHINGSIEGGGCAGCHGQSGTTGAPLIFSDRVNDSTWGTTGHITASAIGAHPKHVTDLGYTECNICHSGHNMPTLDAKLTQVFSGDAVFGGAAGTYVGKTLGGAYTYNPGGISTGGNMDCSNIYCHSDGGNYWGTTAYKTVSWTSSGLGCDKCHGNGAGTLVTTDKHPKHLTYSYTCQECHAATVDGANAIIGNHVNTVKNVQWKAGGLNDGGSAYARPSCTVIYCHSQGKSLTSPYGGQAWTTARWNGATPTCEGCHSYTAGSSHIMDSGKHTQHVNQANVLGTNYGCQACHSNTTSDGVLITNMTNHVNGTRDTSVTCSNTYCHSTGQATWTAKNPPSWTTIGGALGCNGCHGAGNAYGAPDYANGPQPTVVENNDNSHAAHATSAADCTNCHTNTVETAGTAIKAGSALHTDGTRNVDIAAALDTNGGVSNYDSGTKFCSGISCHGAGTPMWGGASLACDQCHLANNTLQGKHGKHYGVATVAVQADKTPNNTSTGTIYEFSCGVCHNATPHATGNVSTNQAANVVFDPTFAIGGTYNSPGTLAGTDTGGMEWTNGTCSTTYCHSQGQSTTSPFGGNPWTTATWNGAAMNCAGCHGGLAGDSPAIASGKHTKHITTYSYTCNRCHNSTTTTGNTITDTSKHVNKTKEVQFDAWAGNSAGGTSCTTTYCHSQGTSYSGSYSHAAIPWTTITNCGSCHTGGTTSGPSYPDGSPKDNSHNKHVVVRSNTCQNCHNAVVNGTNTIISTTNHVNQQYNVNPGGTFNSAAVAFTVTNTPNPTTPAICQSISCHGAGSPNATWGDTTMGCTGCHNDGTDDGTLTHAAPATGKHNIHVNSPAAGNTYVNDCADCHGTNANTGAHTGHIGGSATFGGKLTIYDDVNKTCTNDCHLAGNNTWVATPASLGCTDCHVSGKIGYTNAPHTSGLHWATMSTPHNHTLGAGCTECHNSTPAVSHLNGAYVADSASNNDRFITAKASMVWTDAAAGSGTCAGTDLTGCHSDAGDWYRQWNTQANSTATTIGSARCNVCHGQWNSWRTGTSHITNPTRGATQHDSIATPTCGQCHALDSAAYNWATQHEDNKITMNVNGVTSNEHNVVGYSGCTNCHGGAADANHRFPASTFALGTITGDAIQGGDCIVCHEQANTIVGGPYNGQTRRGIVGTGFDFDMAVVMNGSNGSRHLFAANTITKWDCVVCHREGSRTDGSAGAYHHGASDTNHIIQLRNVDTTNENVGFDVDNKAWRTIDYANLDLFCVSCHDSDGALANWVNNTNDGISSGTTGNRNLVPFNTRDWTSTAGGGRYIKGSTEHPNTGRNAVIDIKGKFYPGTAGNWSTTNYNGNPSQHAVLGTRYGTKNPTWNGQSGLVWGTLRLKKMGTILRNVGETAILSCADCHILDSGGGAHRSTGLYFLYDVGTTLAGLDWRNNCGRCHSTEVYNEDAGITQTTIGRANHSNIDAGGRLGTQGVYGQPSSAPSQNQCLHCHAGWLGQTTASRRASYGNIHGSWTTYTNTGGGTYTGYRFFPGATLKPNPPGGWTTTAANMTCYFSETTEKNFSSCTTHQSTGSSTAVTNPVNYNRAVRY